MKEIENLLVEMKRILFVACVPKHQIRIRSGKHKTDTYANAFDWLHNLYMSDAYHQVKAIYNLLPEEIWRRYDLFEIEGLREQILLEAACKKLFKAWRTKRPQLFNKDKKRS